MEIIPFNADLLPACVHEAAVSVALCMKIVPVSIILDPACAHIPIGVKVVPELLSIPLQLRPACLWIAAVGPGKPPAVGVLLPLTSISAGIPLRLARTGLIPYCIVAVSASRKNNPVFIIEQILSIGRASV